MGQARKIEASLSSESLDVAPRPPPSKTSPTTLVQHLHQRFGNRDVGSFLQAKLKVSQPQDRYEQEADRAAEQVMRMRDPADTQIVAGDLSAAPDRMQRACANCEEADEELHRKADNDIGFRHSDPSRSLDAPVANASINLVSRGGEPLAESARAYFEPRFGRDFASVRVHRDEEAAHLAHSVNARAFTVGRDVVFAPGQYAPENHEGRRLIAHELAHVIQQRGSIHRLNRREDVPGKPRQPKPGRASETDALVRERVDTPTLARQLDPSMCASNCTRRDGTEAPQTDYELTIYADKEGPFLLLPITHGVGHSWLRLSDTSGNYWTYGFWPQSGFDASHLTKDVAGCVHHPDTRHSPTATQTFKLTAAEFAAAKAKAISICGAKPNYNLFGLQCTSFVGQVLEAAGKNPALGFGLIWESPNALNSWMKSNALVIGAGFTAATSTPGGAGTGTFGLDLSYTRQFYSMLGEKLRFHWISRGELSTRQATVSTGLGFELTSQRVFLPSAYVFGGGIAGGLTPNIPGGSGLRPAAGLTGGAGLLFNVDEFMTIGVEYNVVKDLVNQDPDLNRLMLRVGLKF